MEKKSPVTVPPKASEINERSLLMVEWTEGTRKRRGGDPQVLIDGEEAGHVDERIFLMPGDFQVSVRSGRHTTPLFPCRFSPGRAVVLEYQSTISPLIIITILIGIFFYLLIPIAIDWLPNVSSNVITWVLIATYFGLFTLAEHFGIPVHHKDSLRTKKDFISPLAEWVDGTGSDRDASGARRQRGRLLVNLTHGADQKYPLPKVYVNGKSYGPTGDIAYLSAGRYSVEVRGWFERSSEFPISIEPGELVELNVTRTSGGIQAMVAMAIPSLTAIITVIVIKPFDWAVPIMLIGVAIGCAAALLVARKTHTLDLHF